MILDAYRGTISLSALVRLCALVREGSTSTRMSEKFKTPRQLRAPTVETGPQTVPHFVVEVNTEAGFP
jgi:hypothetical protein